MRNFNNKTISILLASTLGILVFCDCAYVQTQGDFPEVEVVEQEPEIIRTPQDYQQMAQLCFEAMQEKGFGVHLSETYDYADGTQQVLDNNVYADTPVYFDDIVLCRFVSDSGVVTSLISDGILVYDVRDLDMLFIINNTKATDLELQVASNFDSVVVCVQGKSDLNLYYYDRCLVSTEDGTVYLVRLAEDGSILDKDVI